MAISASPISSSLHINVNSRISSSSPVLPLFNVSSKSIIRQSNIIICSQKSGGGLTSEDKQALFERYGLDPKQFLSETSPKSRRKKEVKQTGREKRVPEEEAKPPRMTHRLLQVLGGKAKRKKLLSPKGMDVRPMMEVVKGSAFDILQAAGGCPASLRPGCWLDLYSGTGSVGIEAISRGCSEVHFVEMDPWVVSNVLQPNLESTGFLDVSVIHTASVENFLEQAEQFVGRHRTFDFISVTPPYMEVDYGILMDQISKSALVGENTFIFMA
ncbi:putative rRNA methyltransferase YlbH isoform X2 [Jatropha curcas]|uniref:putative rRNA methyltransferase YlbH isoform X2 n=1 Tax=Jatropha curcas TaxID=180498 RepID=UPI0005FB6F89|nr:putative rRNA methyltransferase YlbH isoform X2 [Jatropha curcas]